MPKYKLRIEYDGSRYRGWQIQPNARTIQGVIRAAAQQVFGDEVDVQGAGRTDAGVHALAQVAHLEAPRKLEPIRVQYGLNDLLPTDICITRVEPALPQFHARHDATGRSYLYLISTRRTAFGRHYAWWIRDRLNPERMAEAASRLEGKHDFASFAEKQVEAGKSTKSLIEEVELAQEGQLILFRIAGSHFLWKMVRRIVGVLVEVGRDKLTAEDIECLLAAYSPVAAPLTAPPCGLYLQQVRYEGDDWEPLFVPQFPLIS
jgi:tRNA pseudouridine38-40 synthase